MQYLIPQPIFSLEVCCDVLVEPQLQPVGGADQTNSCNMQNRARLDILVKGFGATVLNAPWIFKFSIPVSPLMADTPAFALCCHNNENMK